MQRIIVPTDYSKEAEYAALSAVSLAQKSGGIVIFYHVLEKTESREEAEEKLKQFSSSIEFQQVQIEYIISDGAPLDAIITAGGDLIVIGSKGASGLKSFFIGTVAEKVAKHSPCPVIVVKEATDLSNIRSIVYPTDMRQEQDQIIEDLKRMQKFYGANLHLLKVYDDAVLKRRTVEDKLRVFAEKSELEQFSVTGRSGVNEAEEIIDFATELNAGMIAIATHERFGIEKLLGGLISGSVINKARIAIWCKAIKTDED